MLKLLNVIDEYSRECLAIDVGRSIDADGVVACLERLATERGAPAYVRFDHGPEFIAYAVADWCRFNHTNTVFIDPGSPWQNAWIESFNGRLRDEFLNGQLFETLFEAQVFLEDWRIDYNCNRPHSAHGWLTPVEFVEAWFNQQQLQLAYRGAQESGSGQWQRMARYAFAWSSSHTRGCIATTWHFSKPSRLTSMPRLRS